MFYSPAFTFSSGYLLGFCHVPGFAFGRCASFKPFGPPALGQQAPPAILLAALRRFRGPAVFLGLRTSSRLGAPFWPSGLTLRSSGSAFCGPLTLAVSLRKIRNIEAHVLFTGVYLLKRLFVGFWISRRASPFGAAPVFSFFASIASLPWHTAFSRFALVVNLGLPILASVANRSVKPTRLRRAAYFCSLDNF